MARRVRAKTVKAKAKAAKKETPKPVDPHDSWSVEELTAAALGCLQEFSVVARKSVELLAQAGGLLRKINQRLTPHKGWGKWLKENKVNETTAAQAIKLFQWAKDNNVNVAEFDSITEAKIAAGIVQRRTSVSVAQHDRGQQTDANELLGLDAENMKLLREEAKRLFAPVKSTAAKFVQAIDELEASLDAAELNQQECSVLSQLLTTVEIHLETLQAKVSSADSYEPEAI